MEQSPPTKKSFGICNFVSTSPVVADLKPDTQILNVNISFEEALKLNLAIDECVRKLNSYKRSTSAGKRSGLTVALHLSRGVITIVETTLPKAS
jgi:hypothetical protein